MHPHEHILYKLSEWVDGNYPYEFDKMCVKEEPEQSDYVLVFIHPLREVVHIMIYIFN